MRYTDFKESIQKELRLHPSGLTWVQLRDRLALPYDRPCPEWVKHLEQEIGLVRVRREGRSQHWKLTASSSHPTSS
ncbi:MAG TPA: hypothetical protein VGE29_20710 [Prosthecobacter sp.]